MNFDVGEMSKTALVSTKHPKTAEGCESGRWEGGVVTPMAIKERAAAAREGETNARPDLGDSHTYLVTLPPFGLLLLGRKEPCS